MQRHKLANDVTSNVIPFAVIYITTHLVFRAKISLCDSYRRMPVQIRMDLMLVIVCNLLAFSLLVMWTFLLSDGAAVMYEGLLSFDLTFGILLQRRLLQLVHKYDTAPYHEPGPLALVQRKRRCKVAIIVTSLATTLAAACVASLLKLRTQQAGLGYWTNVALLPCIYAGARTLACDWQGCRPAHISRLMPLEESNATNAFVITDDEDEESITAALASKLDGTNEDICSI